MSEASEMPDDYAPRGGRTKYTTCRYCGKSFPLREISRHAKTMHFEESTKYTDCRLCGRSVPLRDIREHARNCDGVPEPTLPKIERSSEFGKGTLADTFSMTIDGSLFQDRMRAALIEADDKLAEPIVIEWLRGRGYSVDKLSGPLSKFCPNCQAKPGQPCSTPTDTGRRDVRSDWFHYARRDVANDA